MQVEGLELDLQNGKVFRVSTPFPSEFGDPSDTVVMVWGFPNGDREPSFGQESDLLGYAYIREEGSFYMWVVGLIILLIVVVVVGVSTYWIRRRNRLDGLAVSTRDFRHGYSHLCITTRPP